MILAKYFLKIAKTIIQYTEKLKKSSFICYILYIYSMWEWITKELEPASGKGYLKYTEAENENVRK